MARDCKGRKQGRQVIDPWVLPGHCCPEEHIDQADFFRCNGLLNCPPDRSSIAACPEYAV
jgi:hypothetical protein